MSSPLNGTRIALIGHPDADLEGVAATIAEPFSLSIAHSDALNYEFAEFAAVVLVMSAYEGAPNELLRSWEEISEFLIPRAIVVTKIDHPDADFDEAVLIARRMFGDCVTPYLVLHADSGEPCAFIDLEHLEIRDYSTGALAIQPADTDHKNVVQEFREEYLESITGLDSPRFTTGLFVPVIPFSSRLRIGAIELNNYLAEVIER